MILKNLTSGKTICKDLKICSSFLDRALGLLVPNNPRNLAFNTRFGIHTFFLKAPIDLLILDTKLKVVILKQNLKPGKLFFWNPSYSWVIELNKNSVRKFQIKEGDRLSIS